MKILVTGMTAKQIGTDKAFQFATNCGSLVSLLSNDHTVERRGVTPGEDLSSYDRVVVNLGPINAFGSQYAYGALWALASRPDAIYALNDWQVKQVMYAAKTFVKSELDKGLFKPILPRRNREEARAVADQLLGVCRELAGEGGAEKRQCFAPLFRNGRGEKLGFLPVKKFIQFDPSVIWLNDYAQEISKIREQGPIEKERVWIHAALGNKEPWLDKQKFDWPIQRFGNIKLKHERIPERELLKTMVKARGMLSVPQGVPGSGWWRNRFINAAVCGLVVYGDPRELQTIYGVGEHSWLPMPSQVEMLSDERLDEISRLQRDALIDQMMPMNELQEVINKGLMEI